MTKKEVLVGLAFWVLGSLSTGLISYFLSEVPLKRVLILTPVLGLCFPGMIALLYYNKKT